MYFLSTFSAAKHCGMHLLSATCSLCPHCRSRLALLRSRPSLLAHRLNPYIIFDVGKKHDYVDGVMDGNKQNNEVISRKVAEKSYYPALTMFEELTHKHPEFKISLSIPGTLLEQQELWCPDVLEII